MNKPNPQGFKDRANKPPVHLVPTGPLLEIARLYGAGADKVARLSGCTRAEAENNWRQGIKISECYSAAMRHWWRFFEDGEDYDDPIEKGGTGCHHLAAASFWAFAAMTFLGTQDRKGTHPEVDDRFMRQVDQQLEAMIEAKAEAEQTELVSQLEHTDYQVDVLLSAVKAVKDGIQWCPGDCKHERCDINHKMYLKLVDALAEIEEPCKKS